MERIGFIGLGIMGKPMAANLLAAGFPLTVHNRSRAPMEELAARGAATADSPAALAATSDVVITMLPDSPDVEAVVLGEQGVLSSIRAGCLFIDCSTIAPASARRIAAALAERGVEALARARPIFAVLGSRTTHVGAAGAGQVTKAANQIVVALTIQAVAEALTLARKAGVEAARVREALLGGFAQSRILEAHGQRMLEGAFEPGFKLRLHRKDLGIALELGRERQVPLFGTAQVAELMDALLAHGAGERDHSALALLYERLSALGGPGGG